MEKEIEFNPHITKARENLRQAKEILAGATNIESRVQIKDLEERVGEIHDPQEKTRSQETLRKIQQIRDKLQ